VPAAPHHAVGVHLEFAGGAKGDDFIAHLDAEPGEVCRAAVGPFNVDAVEAFVLTGGLDVLLHGADPAADSCVDAVLGDQDAAGQSQLFAEGTLPEPHGVGISDGGKAVKKDDSVQSHVFKGTGLDPGGLTRFRRRGPLGGAASQLHKQPPSGLPTPVACEPGGIVSSHEPGNHG
jgi:hypothetical protein